MDNYLEEFTEQLESSFKAESLLPVKQERSGWLIRLFATKKSIKMEGGRNEVEENAFTERLFITGELQ